MKKNFMMVLLALMVSASFTGVRGQMITNAFEWVDAQNRLHIDYNCTVNGDAVIFDFVNFIYATDTAVIGANEIVTGILDPGTYSTDLLRVTDSVGNYEDWQVPTFTIFGPPTITLSVDTISGDIPFSPTFTVATTGIVDSVLINFGDGQISVLNGNSISHTYNVSGTYNVSAVAYGPGGEVTSNIVSVTAIAQLPDMHWIFTVINGPIATITFFTNVGGDFSVSPSSTFSTSTTSVDAGENTIVMDPLPSGTYNTLVFTVVTAQNVSENLQIPVFVIANNPPSCDFIGSPLVGTAPLAVQFSDQSTPGTNPITNWSWNFGDENSSIEQNPSHTYMTSGLYTVTLTVSDSTSLSGTMTRVDYILVEEEVTGPTADFIGDPTNGNAPLDVQFTDLSTPGNDPIISWVWDFGDGTTSNAQHPNHTYAASELYTVTLVVSDGSLSDTMTRVEYIEVSENVVGPTADFIGSPTTGTAPLAVQFTDQSTNGTNPITNWSWNFGDGATSNAQHPNHTYTASGLYTVTLVVSDGSLSDTMTRVEYIEVSENVVGPTADFIGSPITGIAPLLVQFTDQSTNGTNPIISWAWDFGDGTTSNEEHPAHVYTATGTYTVSLIVSDGSLSDTMTRMNYITVTEQIPTGPTADFSGCPLSGDAPLEVIFDDNSIPGSNSIISWYWTFGDGSTSTEQNPIHTYVTPGLYTVSLIVSDGSLSDTMTRIEYILVTEEIQTGPTADFVGCPLSGDTPLNVNFNDNSTAGSNAIISWYWTFGDGSTSTEQNPAHVYTTSGLYTVTLVVSDGSLSDTMTRVEYIKVDECIVTRPVADFIGIPTSGYNPLTVHFANFSQAGTDSISSYIWNFGDGITSTEKHPQHVYTSLGVYSVTLYVSDGSLSDMMTRPEYITVTDPNVVGPSADFIGIPTSGCNPLTVHFANFSQSGTDSISSYIWNFGDGITSTEKHPQHVYTSLGVYSVTLYVSDGSLSDIMTRTNYIIVEETSGNEITADFIADPPTGTAPFATRFINLSQGSIMSYFWNFGDENTSTEKHPVHTFMKAGDYAVELTVSDGVSTESATEVIHVDEPIALEMKKWEMWSWNPNDPFIAYPKEVVEYELALTTQPDSLRLLINDERSMLGWSFGSTYQGTFSVPDSMATGYPSIIVRAWKDGQLIEEEFLGEVFIKGYDLHPKLFRLQSNHLFNPSPQGGTVYQATVGDDILLEFNGRQPEEVYFLGREAMLLYNKTEDLWYVETTVTEFDLTRDSADFVVKYTDLNISTTTTDGSIIKLIPVNQQLLQNYPNPANGSSTTIPFRLKKRSQIRLEVFNILGQRIAVLEEYLLEAGFYEHKWHTDTLAKGTYVCRLMTFDDLRNKTVDTQNIKIIVQ